MPALSAHLSQACGVGFIGHGWWCPHEPLGCRAKAGSSWLAPGRAPCWVCPCCPPWSAERSSASPARSEGVCLVEVWAQGGGAAGQGDGGSAERVEAHAEGARCEEHLVPHQRLLQKQYMCRQYVEAAE